MDDKNRKDVLGEALFDELQAIREGTDQIPELSQRVGGVEERLNSVDGRLQRLEAKVDVIGDAIKGHVTDKSLHT